MKELLKKKLNKWLKRKFLFKQFEKLKERIILSNQFTRIESSKDKFLKSWSKKSFMKRLFPEKL